MEAKRQLHHEERLLRERGRILRSLERLRTQAEEPVTAAAGDLSNYPFHMADQSAGSLDREQLLAEADQQSRYLGAIEAALERFYHDPDRFGLCHRCGEPIPWDRLELVPHTRYCLGCKLTAESGRKPVAA